MPGLLPVARADPVYECPDPTYPDRCFAVGLEAGDPAPIAGDLFSVPMAIDLNQRAFRCPELIAAAVSRTSSTAAADAKRDRAVQAADHRVDLVEAKQEGHKEGYAAGSPNWYAHPIIVAALAVAATIGIAVAVKKSGAVD